MHGFLRVLLFNSVNSVFQLYSSDPGARIGAGEAREKVIHLGTRRGRKRRAGPSQRIRGDDSAPHHHVLAHREARTWLLLVADERQVRVEEVVRGVALTLPR